MRSILWFSGVIVSLVLMASSAVAADNITLYNKTHGELYIHCEEQQRIPLVIDSATDVQVYPGFVDATYISTSCQVYVQNPHTEENNTTGQSTPNSCHEHGKTPCFSFSFRSTAEITGTFSGKGPINTYQTIASNKLKITCRWDSTIDCSKSGTNIPNLDNSSLAITIED